MLATNVCRRWLLLVLLVLLRVLSPPPLLFVAIVIHVSKVRAIVYFTRRAALSLLRYIFRPLRFFCNGDDPIHVLRTPPQESLFVRLTGPLPHFIADVLFS